MDINNKSTVSFHIRYWLDGQNSSSVQEKTVYKKTG